MSTVRTAETARPAGRIAGDEPTAETQSRDEASEQRPAPDSSTFDNANTIESERASLRSSLDAIAAEFDAAEVDRASALDFARRQLAIVYQFAALQALKRGDADTAKFCDRVALPLSDPTGGMQRHLREMFFVMLFIRGGRRPLLRWRMLCPVVPRSIDDLEVLRVTARYGITFTEGKHPRRTCELELFRKHGITANERLLKQTRNDVRAWAPLGAALTAW